VAVPPAVCVARAAEIRDDDGDGKHIGHRPLRDDLDEAQGAFTFERIAAIDRPHDEHRLDERHEHAEQENEGRGRVAADLVQVLHRSQDAARLLIDLDLLAVLELRRERLRQPIDHRARRPPGEPSRNGIIAGLIKGFSESTVCWEMP
jgi:hypothetical protein